MKKYSYEVTVKGQKFEFESQHHINTLNILSINGARMVGFYDAEIWININHIDELKINGKSYKLNRAYHKKD